MALRDINLDLLAKMSEDWRDSTDMMLTIAIGMVLLECGRTEVTIDLSKMAENAARYEIDRKYTDHPDGTKYLTVSLKERVVDDRA